MKSLLIIILLMCIGAANAQTWQSIPKQLTGNTVGWLQFVIDPYTNNIWLNSEEQVAVVENDGIVKVFNTASGELGTMWWGSNLRFAFTPNHVYCASRGYGLRSFDNYIAQPEYSFSEYDGGISTYQDTVFILDVEVGGSNRWVKFIDGSITLEIRNADYTIAKNGYQYSDLSYLVHYTVGSQYDNISTIDPDYLWSGINDMKFTRLTDTLYVSGKLGINKVHNYDVFDTITPNNTINMPSPNVLEMEFDHEDKLWCVFGDDNDKAFAIARLDGNQWVDLINWSNSPIYFGEFYGMEIDTLGNLWFSDMNALHTIVTPSSPTWLGVEELNKNVLSVYPNPFSNSLTINFSDNENSIKKIKLTDIHGRLIEEVTTFEDKYTFDTSNLIEGFYFVSSTINDRTSTIKVVKR